MAGSTPHAPRDALDRSRASRARQTWRIRVLSPTARRSAPRAETLWGLSRRELSALISPSYHGRVMGRTVNSPAVQDARPPRNVIRFVNPVMKALLRSPLHRLLSKNLMLLTVTGRKTGRVYTVPVGRHESADGSFVLSAGGNWRHNLRGGADVRITLDGQERAGTPCSKKTATEPPRPLRRCSIARDRVRLA